jgi:two-component system, NtrC family, response regulator AtoC
MASVSLHVLIVEDDEASGDLVREILTTRGHRVELVTSARAALARLGASPLPDVVLLDVMMPEMGGIEMLRRYRQAGGAVPVVMVSGVDEAQTVVGAMRVGASDYVTKPINAEEIFETLERVVERNPVRASTSTSVITRAEPLQARMLGVSAAMRRVEALLDRVADADVPILITGESGVGKDVVARELHARSSRRDRVFVKINCAALPESLLESELFGYERGAFTGAQRAKPGQFELANGGTLFLDEIGEMPAPLQAKLLQALQDGEFYRVGGQKKVKVDVRVIVATNVNLERAILEGRFREDLYYRLNVVQVRIPPLRERREDIPILLSQFIERYGRRYGRSANDVPPEVVQRFLAYDWPGNVRELENLVRRLMVLRDPSYVYAEMRPRAESVNAPQPMAEPTEAPLPPFVLPMAAMGGPPGPPQQPPSPPPFLPTTVSAPIATELPPARIIAFTEDNPRSEERGAPMAPLPMRGGSYPFGGYASSAAGRPLGEVVAEEFANAGPDGKVDLKALGRKAAEIAEREAIVAMLARTGGSKREAAVRLGISYKAILYKIREFGIGRPRTPRKPVPGPILPTDASPMPDVDVDEAEDLDDAFGEEVH